MEDVVDAYLAHRFRWRPVDATFMGAPGHDDRLPPVGPDLIAAERDENAALATRVAAAEGLHPHDRSVLLSDLEVERANLSARPRQHNPAWYTGEAAFGLISLLLPQSEPWRREAIGARIAAIPAFLQAGAAELAGRAVPAGWVARARAEAAALADFLRSDIALHPGFHAGWRCAAAATAFDSFVAALDGLPDADPACGAAHLAFLFKTQHMLDITPDEAVEAAHAAFARNTDELVAMARAIDPETPWQDQIAALSQIGPKTPDAVLDHYRALDAAARDAAEDAGLVTPERAYGLDYRVFPDWAAKLAGATYFLFYRSPPGLIPGQGSVYWVARPGADLSAHSTAMVKTIHAVHHGSIGHHTQNAAARRVPSRLGRIAGTDCAMGIAFQGALTLIEGWACHVEDLLIEAEGFYTPAEVLLLKSFERRNAASVLVDVNLHSGRWSQAEAARFYAEEAGFAPARVQAEVVRNSMFPASRATYWLGVEGIRALRRRWQGSTADFHDRLISFGHVPLSLVADEMTRAGQLRA